MSANNIYYVYSYMREDGTPYYIGKGKGSRYKAKHNVSIPPEDRIQFIQTDMDEKSAHDLEIELIAKYGRKDNGTGILRNLTDGGEGSSGRVYNHTEETKKILSEKSAENNPRYWKGKTFSDDHKSNISSAISETVWITNGEETVRINSSEDIPEGWSRGRHYGLDYSDSLLEKRKKQMSGNTNTKGTKWINDGTKTKMIPADSVLPDGWVYGRIINKRK